MRTWCAPSIVLLSLCLAPGGLSAQPTKEEVIGGWISRLESQRERLRKQEWERAAKDSRALTEEMVATMVTGPASARLLALAVAQTAAAEAGLGKADTAIWLWHVAKNLDPEAGGFALDDAGPAGEMLRRAALRKAGTRTGPAAAGGSAGGRGR